jgi:hypothetical protein
MQQVQEHSGPKNKLPISSSTATRGSQRWSVNPCE